MLTELERRVLEAVEARRDEAVRLLQEMVRTPSVNPRFDPSSRGEVGMARLVQSRYEALGIPCETVEVEPGRPNAIARVAGEGGGPTLLVNCHLDTVAPYDADAWYDPLRQEWLHDWSVDPFSGELHDDMIWGRGAADHKMPIAATLAALGALRAAGVRLGGDLVLVHDADEETGGRAGMRALAERGLVEADAALYACTTGFTPEATRFFSALGEDNVIRALQGVQRARVTVTGRTYHTLTPKVGRNAAENTLPVLEALSRLAARVNARIDPLTGSGQPLMRIVRVASEAPAPSRPANQVAIEVVRRIPPGTDADAAFDELRQAVEQLARPEAGFEVACERLSELPPSLVAEDDPLVTAFASASEDVRGRPPRVTGIPSSVGISQFLAIRPLPTVMFGYGILNFHHAFDERVAVEDLVDTAKAYALGFMRYLGVAGR